MENLTPGPNELSVIFTHKSGPTNTYLIFLGPYPPPLLKPPSFQVLLTKNKRYNVLLNSTYGPTTEPTLMTIVFDTTDNDVICSKISNDPNRCNKASAPGIVIKTNTEYNLKEMEIYVPEHAGYVPDTFSSYEEWVEFYDGAVGMYRELSILLDIVDAYLGWKELGFTVTLSNLLNTVDLYLGFN